MALNDNIKKFREEKNLTQQQLADKLYVSRQTVCRWENGSRCPDLITAKKLALELDVSMDDMRVPGWCTIICFIIVAVAFLCNFIVSKKLREM